MDTLKQENKSNEKVEVKIAKLKVDADRIVKALFTSNNLEVPEILYGKKAEDFVKNEAINGQEFLAKKSNGCLIRDFKEREGSEVTEKDRRTGVVCIFKIRIATLAHELRHSYQWQTDKSLFANTKEEKELYEAKMKKWNKKDYYNTPAEKDAFTYAMQYLNTHSGLFSGFFKRWEYRFDIMLLKNVALALVMLIGISVVLVCSLLIAVAPELGICYKVGSITMLCLLLYGICRVLMGKERFKKLE